MEAQQQLLTLNDVANEMNVSRSTVRNMLADRRPGGLPFVQLTGRALRVRPADLRAYLERHAGARVERVAP